MHTLPRVQVEQFSSLKLRKMFLWEVKKYDSYVISVFLLVYLYICILIFYTFLYNVASILM
jgi:hypothetical protein